MNPISNLRPGAIAASEPVAVATAVRALIYLFLVNRGVDAETMAMVLAAFEVVLAYVTRRAVTPLRKLPPPPPPPSDGARHPVSVGANP